MQEQRNWSLSSPSRAGSGADPFVVVEAVHGVGRAICVRRGSSSRFAAELERGPRVPVPSVPSPALSGFGPV